jgi:putative GTP pyrophosphokinase
LNETIRIVEKLLLGNKIPVAFKVSGRFKDFASIEEKNYTKRYTIKKSITELNDLVGLRIVLLFPEFKEQVIELLLTTFKPISEYRKNKQSVDKFGYSSAHLILTLKEEWLHNPTLQQHANKKVEVQVRTLSEHIWAETSHSLFYKREENIPNVITRDLYKLSALLEVVDDKLQHLKKSVSNHFQYLQRCPYEEILKMDLNSETFKRVMLKNSRGVYSLDDNKNKELSSRVERDYNIVKAELLNEIISDKINLENIDNDTFINSVLELLNAEKDRIDKSHIPIK